MAEKSPQAKGSTPAPRGRPATAPATAPGAREAGSAQERPALASLRAAAERLAEEERARPAVMSSSRPATVVSEPRQVFAARPVPASAPAVPPVPPPPPAAYPVPPVPRPASSQGYTAPPQMAFGATTSSAGPSRRGYALAAAIAIVGLVIGVGGVVRGFSQLSDRVDRLERIDVPGSRDLTFDATGDFTIYYEAPGADAGPDVLPPLTITVASQGGGSQVAMEKYGSTFTYSIDGYEGMALATFRIESPGTYTLTATSPIPPGLAQLAVGRSLGSTFVQTLLPILFLLATLLAASLLAIVTAIRRRNARRA